MTQTEIKLYLQNIINNTEERNRNANDDTDSIINNYDLLLDLKELIQKII